MQRGCGSLMVIQGEEKMNGLFNVPVLFNLSGLFSLPPMVNVPPLLNPYAVQMVQ